MANRWAVANGNSSNPATWNGGTLPAVTDDVYSNGFVVTIDQTSTWNKVRNVAGSGIVAGGRFDLTTGVNLIITSHIVPADVGAIHLIRVTGGNPTINSNISGGGTSGFHTLNVTGGTPTVYGTVTGNVGYGVVGDGGTLTVNGHVTAAGGAAGILTNNVAFTPTINGNVTGGTSSSAAGLYMGAAGASATINGNVTGGTGPSNHGVYFSAQGTMTVNGKVTATAAPAIFANAGTPTVTVYGEAIGAAGISPLSGAMTYSVRATGPFPSANNVRSGIAFGPASTITGTLIVPPSSSVSAGVPVDNTVGTGAVLLSDYASIVGDQLQAVFNS